MYQVTFENATSDIEASINQVVPIMNTVVDYAAKWRFGSYLRARWFKNLSDSLRMRQKLEQMNSYLNKRCTRLTFVVKPLNHRVDRALVEAGDLAQVIRTDYVSSGARIFILPSFQQQPLDEKLNTVCHELSHRVLGTTDWIGNTSIYGESAALALSGDDSIRCAENWGYFYMELAKEMGFLQ